MLYLIKSPSNCGKILKIGYTNDIKRRLDSYKSENPDSELLATREGDEAFEHKLHKYFHRFKYTSGREWFYYNEEIVDEFSTIQEDNLVSREELIEKINPILDISDLFSSKISEIIELCSNNNFREKLTELDIRAIITKFWEENSKLIFPEDYPEILDISKTSISIGNGREILNIHSFLNNIEGPDTNSISIEVCNNLPSSQDSFRRGLEWIAFNLMVSYYTDRFVSYNDIVVVDKEKERKKHFDFFSGYNKQKNRRDKLKYLCEYNLVHGNNIDELLDLIKEKRFKEYITVLGLDQCKATSYSATLLNKRLNILTFDKNKIKEKILSEFEVNKSYTKSFIKEKLGEIYKELGYKAKPKASDLDKYFNVKTCLLSDGSKRVNGFKIISKK